MTDIEVPSPVAEEIRPPWTSRTALRVLQLGAVLIALAVVTTRGYELDRFFVPKELVLHACALLAGLLMFRSIRQLPRGRMELLLGLWVLLSVASSVFSQNPWLAIRATAISASSVILFIVATQLRRDALERPLLTFLAVCVLLSVAFSLAQTYGLDIELFSRQRAPGGTLGNRNSVAHAAAFGFPLVFLCAMRSKRGGAFLLWSLASGSVVATLVLTRSRAAWLAFACVILVMVLAMLLSPLLRRDGAAWRRMAALTVACIAAAFTAMLLPNQLNWRSDNPYLETVKRVADYEGGSGRGRLTQYRRSLGLAASHPILGVGPGNWPVEYPGVVRGDDPSLDDSAKGTTSNPWPSSDWIAALSERGPLAAVALLLVFVLIAGRSFGRLRESAELDDAMAQLALLATGAGVLVTGMFDAVLLLALPSFIVWPAIGALAGPAPADGRNHRIPALAALALVVIAAVGSVRSGLQLAAMELSTSGSRAELERAAALDPGNFRVRLRLARYGSGRERCEHALSAVDLFPHSAAARSAASKCR